MILEDIESSIAAKLVTVLDGSKVDAIVLPDVEADAKKPVQKALVTVAINGLEAGEQRSIGSQVQYPKIRVELIIKARRLRGDWGVYDLERRCRRALMNFRPTGGSTQGMKYLQFQLNAYSEGIFSYSQFFEVTATAIEEFEEYTDDTPRITTIEFDGPLVT